MVCTVQLSNVPEPYPSTVPLLYPRTVPSVVLCTVRRYCTQVPYPCTVPSTKPKYRTPVLYPCTVPLHRTLAPYPSSVPQCRTPAPYPSTVPQHCTPAPYPSTTATSTLPWTVPKYRPSTVPISTQYCAQSHTEPACAGCSDTPCGVPLLASCAVLGTLRPNPYTTRYCTPCVVVGGVSLQRRSSPTSADIVSSEDSAPPDRQAVISEQTNKQTNTA